MRAADAREKAGGRNNQQNSMYLIYIDANYVEAVRSGASTAHDPDASESDDDDARVDSKIGIVEFSTKELNGIRAIMQHEAPLNLLVNSLCPGIWGHELTKLGLLLALVGGVPKHAGSRDRMPLRGDIHILLVGDPGLGKVTAPTCLLAVRSYRFSPSRLHFLRSWLLERIVASCTCSCSAWRLRERRLRLVGRFDCCRDERKRNRRLYVGSGRFGIGRSRSGKSTLHSFLISLSKELDFLFLEYFISKNLALKLNVQACLDEFDKMVWSLSPVYDYLDAFFSSDSITQITQSIS